MQHGPQLNYRVRDVYTKRINTPVNSCKYKACIALKTAFGRIRQRGGEGFDVELGGACGA